MLYIGAECTRKEFAMQTEKFEIILGVVPGYFHDNESESDEAFGEKLQDVQASVYKDTGSYISVVWRPAMVSYHIEWGCPNGGEKVYQITGTRNPEFAQDANVYRKVTELFAKRLMDEFCQSTLTLEWQEVDLTYLKK